MNRFAVDVSRWCGKVDASNRTTGRNPMAAIIIMYSQAGITAGRAKRDQSILHKNQINWHLLILYRQNLKRWEAEDISIIIYLEMLDFQTSLWGI